MIYVNRKKVNEPLTLKDKDRNGFTETDRAIAFYVNPQNNGCTFNFKAYSHPEVKDALVFLFNGKCAYCESSFLHVYSGDIEHFRPKAEIEEAKPNNKPGYYWLAADWDNLLLSCRNCNQKLKHLVYGSSLKKTMGKMNQFPLSDSSKYIRRHNHPSGINREEPYRLLINPCVDNPEEFLEYGEEGVIKAKKDENGIPKAKGVKSIEVYVLQRVPLVQAREKVLVDIQAQIQRVKEAVINYNDHFFDPDSTKKFYFEKILKRELVRLNAFLNEKEQYVGMSRQVIGEFLLTNFNIKISY